MNTKKINLNDVTNNSTFQIDLVRNKWLKIKEQLDDVEYIERLVYSDYVQTIKSQKTSWDYLISTFEKARFQIKEKYKKDRKEFEILKELLIDEFLCGDKSFEITKILPCGHEEYYWDIHFEGKGYKFIIRIPSRKNINEKNLASAYYGKFVFIVGVDEAHWRVETENYEDDAIAQYIKEYLKLGDYQNEIKEI